MPGLLDLASLWELYDLDRPELKDEPFVPATPPRLAESETPKSVFATLREGDVLVHHPYDSFATSVQRFIEQAAADPNVLAIKQTLYRTSGDSPIVDALIEAAEAGKQVVVLVEIKARFDEQANIKWARSLERAGCHVVYGLVGLKTHCKTALVVRREQGVIRRYCHIGTGNYNPKTARIYEDLGILTADPRVGADLTDLFNVLTGYSRQTDVPHAHGGAARHPQRPHREDPPRDRGTPRDGRSAPDPDQGQPPRRREDHRRALPGLAGRRPGRPVGAEVLHDPRRACRGCRRTSGSARSSAGSSSTAGSISFVNGGEPTSAWLGSADLMHRNLDRRVEVLMRVCDAAARSSCERRWTSAMAPDVAVLGAAQRRQLGRTGSGGRGTTRPSCMERDRMSSQR